MDGLLRIYLRALETGQSPKSLGGIRLNMMQSRLLPMHRIDGEGRTICIHNIGLTWAGQPAAGVIIATAPTLQSLLFQPLWSILELPPSSAFVGAKLIPAKDPCHAVSTKHQELSCSNVRAVGHICQLYCHFTARNVGLRPFLDLHEWNRRAPRQHKETHSLQHIILEAHH